jgi:hypothetical protein
MRHHINGLFELIHQEAKQPEALFNKAIQHGRIGVKHMVLAFEGSSRTAWSVLQVVH